MPIGFNAAHVIELSCCWHPTCVMLSLHCPFGEALSFSHHPLHQPHLNPEDPALRQLHTGIQWLPLSPSPLGLPKAPVPPCLRHVLCFLHERIIAFVCLFPLLYYDHFEGHLCRPAPRMMLGYVDMRACSLVFIWKLFIEKGEGPSLHLFLKFHLCLGGM